MLRKIIRGSGFTQSEEKLIEFADDAFFGLWSYPNVYSDEGYSKNKIGKEVSDLLVIFDKDIIIFSDKAITYNKKKKILRLHGRDGLKNQSYSLAHSYLAQRSL
ncbi:hypothetical protein [Klebsiella variicola]|uniref:Uncharacterized protein n=1 Tax=Klebsiella variicola TaxID=244366 RepID=A0A9Q9P0W9_KLEVA|nr:hypothetical protein [Klebsiella variicola]UYA93091.1 hypothetical protein KKR95_p00175 [Klebsiella variicola]